MHLDVLLDIDSDPLFDLGIHPNFFAGSSHGETLEDVLDHCLHVVPGAAIMRTHGLYQSSMLFELVCNRYRQIEFDCSLFLPFACDLQPTHLYLGQRNRKLVRLPTYFEDDFVWRWPQWKWSLRLLLPRGLKIFAFHPIHVALNSPDSGPYRHLKGSINNPLYNVLKSQVERHASPGPGTRDFLEKLVDKLRPAETKRLVNIPTDNSVADRWVCS